MMDRSTKQLSGPKRLNEILEELMESSDNLMKGKKSSDIPWRCLGNSVESLVESST